MRVWWLVPHTIPQQQQRGRAVAVEEEDGEEDEEEEEEQLYCPIISWDWMLVLFTSAWIWLILLVTIVYAAESCQPGKLSSIVLCVFFQLTVVCENNAGTALVLLMATIAFIVITCGGFPSCFGSFPWLIIISSALVLLFLFLAVLEPMDYSAHGNPWTDQYCHAHTIIAHHQHDTGPDTPYGASSHSSYPSSGPLNLVYALSR